jgi:hypothetical protein
MWHRYMAPASRRVVAAEGRQHRVEIRENEREERLLERDRGGGGEERREEAEMLPVHGSGGERTVRDG